MKENEREAQIQRALKALEPGKYTSLGEAAIAFNVPKSTLGHRRMGRQTRRKAHEKEQLLSAAAEEAIVKWILKLDDWGFPPRLDRLWEKVNVLAKVEDSGRYDQATGTPPPHIGRNWITQFLDRHPELAARYAWRIDRQRVRANNPLTIKDHFRKLAALIRTHNIKPNAISNVDEKGFLLGQTAKAKVIGRRGKKNPYVKQHGSREMVTLIEAVTASGFVYPPFLITKGKVHTANFFRNLDKKKHSDILIAKSAKGWTDDELGMEWLRRVYEPYSRKLISPGEKRLLILDGHFSHVNEQFIDFCESHNVALFCLPPHSTHLLQPLDVGLFGPLQHFYGIGIDDYFRDHGENFGFAPQRFLPIYLEARRKAYSLANIESAFRATGIVPLNSRILTKPRVNPEVQGELQVESILLEKTPYTKCQLRQQTNAALAFVKTAKPGKVCNLILRFSHAVEQSFATAEIANSEASRLRTQLKEGSGGQGGAKRKDRKVVSKARVLTVGEGIAGVEEMDRVADGMSAGRGNSRRPSVIQTNGLGSLAIHATPRRTRVRFEAAVTSP